MLPGYDHMIHMGWPVSALITTVIGSFITSIEYGIIGYLHLKSSRDDHEHRWWHNLYGCFIGSCGIGHLAMSWHMFVEFSPWIVAYTHAVTPIVSGWTCYELTKRVIGHATE